MGDSEEDVDYKRSRDKFRTERRGYEGNERGGSPPPGGMRRSGGGDWSRGSWDRRRPYSSDYRRYSPSRGGVGSPPQAKRMRGSDWEERGGGGYYDSHGGDDVHYVRSGPASRNYVGGTGSGATGGGGRNASSGAGSGGDPDAVQPPMMSFKSFLGTQDDSISDEDAVKKFAEYKLEFRRQQLNEFFVHHKDEEWFKLKYHPEDSVKRKDEQKNNLLKRIQVFNKLYDEKKTDGKSLDGDQCEQLVYLLDSVVILLEGGTDNDLKILDKSEEELNGGDKKTDEDKSMEDKGSEDKEEESKEEGGGEEGEEGVDNLNGKEEDEEASGTSAAPEEDSSKKEEKENNGDEPSRKRKRKRTKEFDESTGSSSSSEEDEEMKEDDELDRSTKIPGETSSSQGNNDTKDVENGEEENGEDEGLSKEQKHKDDVDDGEETLMKSDEPRALHRTASIFLRNLAPTITKQEVEAMCKRYSGFLRAAIADPQPDRRWFRRGWVTFERGVKIKEICFNLNNIRLRDCELGPIVNRDLSRRIRTVNGITVDKKIVRNDIRIAAKVITNLDKKWGLWTKEGLLVSNGNGAGNEVIESAEDEALKKKEDDLDDNNLGLSSNNPLLKNITDYLIEEASAEEEELLGKNNDLEDGEEGEEGNSIVRDEELVKVLDRLLFYLRIVHSVDYYNHSEYPNEDEMPNRCGIMHARGIPPTSNVTPTEVEDYCNVFEKKMGSFLVPKSDLDPSEASKLGMKSEDEEVEKFVQANTQELGKDKWLCPLSGKKFKGPDFVRKHIFNKHSEKIQEVKKEVKYYNNYLKDPKRPMLPEHPFNKPGHRGGSHGSNSSGGGRNYHQPDPYHYSGQPREATSYPVYDDRRDPPYGGRERYGMSDRGYRGGGGPRPRQDYGRGRVRDRIGVHPGSASRYDNYGHVGGASGGRPIITYRDLDAPREEDYF